MKTTNYNDKLIAASKHEAVRSLSGENLLDSELVRLSDGSYWWHVDFSIDTPEGVATDEWYESNEKGDPHRFGFVGWDYEYHRQFELWEKRHVDANAWAYEALKEFPDFRGDYRNAKDAMCVSFPRNPDPYSFYDTSTFLAFLDDANDCPEPDSYIPYLPWHLLYLRALDLIESTDEAELFNMCWKARGYELHGHIFYNPQKDELEASGVSGAFLRHKLPERFSQVSFFGVSGWSKYYGKKGQKGRMRDEYIANGWKSNALKKLWFDHELWMSERRREAEQDW